MPASLALTGAMNDIINEYAMRTLWGVWAKNMLVMVKMATEVRPLCRVVCVVVVSTSEFQSETFGLLKF